MLTISAILSLGLKSLLLAALALGFLRLARHRTAAERSLIAHLGLLAILLLPIASIALPQWAPLPPSYFTPTEAPSVVSAALSEQTMNAVPQTALSEAAPMPSSTLPSAGDLAIWAYALPLILLFGLMTVAVFRLFAMRRRAEVLVDGAWLAALAQAQRRMGFKHGTALLVSDELRSPISWGVLRPTILLDPRAVSSVGDAEAIIAHELAHVAQLDWARLLIARCACALFWFNPLVWLLARESHQLREEAADDTVLLADVAGSDYAALLVNAARHDNRAVLIAAHGVAPAKNSLRRRVVRVLDANVRRGQVRPGWALSSIAAILGLAAPLSAFSTSPADDFAPVEVREKITAVEGQEIEAASPEFPWDGDTARLAHEVGNLSEIQDRADAGASENSRHDIAAESEERGDVKAGDLIAAKATGMTSDYVYEMRRVFPNVDVDELVGARALGVDVEYAQAMRRTDPNADLDAIIGARAVGVSAAYAQEIRAHLPNASLDDLISMRATGVTADYIRTTRSSRENATASDEVISRRAATRRQRTSPRLPSPGSAGVGNARASAMIVPGGSMFVPRGEDASTTSIIVADPPPPSSTTD